ncbi:ABC transporter substrate-binding protein [Guyparkeria halophila]|uniref:ABC transporter substrate-binding protein n=1 Tax=Guyparkeria halophila TaxID=47960 RepID=A0ABZ0YVH6_9GAMM|nr:ABC transporter substrate-binding protein [Guyparkeria halophila]WQH15272.1 ABC transporter substrate-binding protein [Guyparkeria halophila]
MERRQFLVTGALAPLAALLGCEGREPLLRVSGITWVGYEPLFLARELDLLPPDRIRLIESPSNTNSLMQLASGEVEVATLTLDEFILARAGGIPVRIALVFDTSQGADVVMARPGIDRLEDLAGRRIGVEETAAGALMLRKSLEATGLTPEDVIRVPVIGSGQLSAYQEGAIDAVISYEPFASRLAALGATRLHDSSAFPGLIVDVLAVSDHAVNHQPRALTDLLTAYFESLAVIQSSPGRAHRLMAPRLGLTVEGTALAYEGIALLSLADNHAWLKPPATPLREAAITVAEIMQSNALIEQVPDLSNLATAGFLPEGP